MPGLASPSTCGCRRSTTSAINSFSMVLSGMPSGMLKNTSTPSASACGRKSIFGASSHASSGGRVSNVRIQAARRCGVFVRPMTCPVIVSQVALSRSPLSLSLRKKLLATGRMVIAATIDVATAMDSVSARSANSCPSSPSMNRIGRKIAMLVTVDANRAPTTCAGPRRVACSRDMPPCRNRTMFS